MPPSEKNQIFSRAYLAHLIQKVVPNCKIIITAAVISLGFKIKEISAKMDLTEAAINKRISKIKDNLNIKETSGLLKEAKIRNYI